MAKAKTPRWNVWRIKNKFARMLFTVFLLTPAMFASVVFVAAVSVCAGIAEGTSYAWYTFTREQKTIRPAMVGWWRAVTLRSSPC